MRATTTTRKDETMSSKQKQARWEHLKQQARNTRELQYNASEMRNANQVVRLERELLAIYAEMDALLPRS